MDADESLITDGLDQADARLAEMEKAQAARQSPTKPKDSATPAANRAAANDTPPTVPSPDSKSNLPPPGDTAGADKTGTPSAADSDAAKKAEADKAFAEAAAKKKEEDAKAKASKYAQDRERRDKSWKEINAEKEAHAAKVKADQDATAAQRRQLEADRAQFQREQSQQQDAEKPEAYEYYAGQQDQKVAALLTQAKQAEDAGDFDKAEKLREQANEHKVWAKSFRERAQKLRENPPAGPQQRQAATQAKIKEWMLKATTDFPDFAKANSDTQKEYVQFMQLVQQNYPQFAGIPELVYFAVERADLKLQAARHKTAADRVPALEKELGELKTKLTELEALTNPTPGGGSTNLPAAKEFNELSSKEQFDQLKRDAQALDGGRL